MARDFFFCEIIFFETESLVFYQIIGRKIARKRRSRNLYSTLEKGRRKGGGGT
jgi:hypothetical protein